MALHPRRGHPDFWKRRSVQQGRQRVTMRGPRRARSDRAGSVGLPQSPQARAGASLERLGCIGLDPASRSLWLLGVQAGEFAKASAVQWAIKGSTRFCAGGWVEPGPSLVAWRRVLVLELCAVWTFSPFTVGRSPSTRCKTAGRCRRRAERGKPCSAC